MGFPIPRRREPIPRTDRERALDEHGGLAFLAVQKYGTAGLPFDEAVQAARTGLVYAIDRRDTARPAEAWSSYAVSCARGYVLRAAGREGHYGKYRYAIQHRRHEKGLGIHGRAFVGELPYVEDVPLGPEADDDPVLADRIAEEPPYGLGESSLLWRAVAALGARDREVLVRRFVADDSLEAIGTDLGVSRERVRQIEARALGRLRRVLSREPVIEVRGRRENHDVPVRRVKAEVPPKLPPMQRADPCADYCVHYVCRRAAWRYCRHKGDASRHRIFYGKVRCVLPPVASGAEEFVAPA